MNRPAHDVLIDAAPPGWQTRRLTSRFEPLIRGVLPALSDMRPIAGSPLRLGLAMLLNWTLASFGEEMAWRGYLLNRMKSLFGQPSCGRGPHSARLHANAVGQVLGLFLVSALFGVAHGESQGLGGVLQEGFAGLMLGSMYVASGCRLAVPIIAHGASNTLALVLIYFNRYPGL